MCLCEKMCNRHIYLEPDVKQEKAYDLFWCLLLFLQQCWLMEKFCPCDKVLSPLCVSSVGCLSIYEEVNEDKGTKVRCGGCAPVFELLEY